MKLLTVLLISAVFVVGCSSSSNPEPDLIDPARQSEFEGRWILTDYTLDDGTMKLVPDSIQNEAIVGIFVTADTLVVQSGLCESYQASYQLDNDVLVLSDSVFPELSCQALYADADNAERSELMSRTFLNSQTLIIMSLDLLIVTTMQNETLRFQRLVQ